MKFAVFCYDFPHWKTQTGLFALYVNGFVPEIVIGAPYQKLNICHSKIRIVHKDLYLEEPSKICSKFGFEYISARHDAPINRTDLDFGLILGARILKKPTIDQFKYGIINFHPGILPENRGLDNVKWAVKNDWPQGVTSHFINEKVDSGCIINLELVDIYKDDSLLDIQFRVQNKEIEMMVSTMRKAYPEGILLLPKDNNTLKCLTDEEESTLASDFIKYKEKRGLHV